MSTAPDVPGIAVEIHPSSLTAYLDCPRRAIARSFPRLVAEAGYQLRSLPPHVGAATGTATHAGAALMLRWKMAGKLSADSMTAIAAEPVDVALDALDGALSEGVIWDDIARNRAAAREQVVRRVIIYGSAVLPRVRPVAVEESLRAQIAGDDTATLAGTVDVREPDGIRDTKTGILRANGAQYGAYALLQRAHGRVVERLTEDFIPRAPLSRVQPPPVTISYDVAECEEAASRIIARMIADIRRFAASGDPWELLPNPGSVLCSDRFCPAHSTPFCRAHKEVINRAR